MYICNLANWGCRDINLKLQATDFLSKIGHIGTCEGEGGSQGTLAEKGREAGREEW